MNFSRFQIGLIALLLFLIVGSTTLSILLSNQQIFAEASVRSVFRLPQPTVAHAGSLPAIADIDFAKLDQQLALMTNKEVTLSWDETSTRLSAKDLDGFVTESLRGGYVEIDVNEQAIEQYIKKLARKIDVAMKPRQVTQDGEVVDEGKTGRQLDREHAENAIIQALLMAGKTKTITLQIKDIDLEQKVVAKPFTPGLYEGKYIEINLTNQTMYVFEGSNLINHFIISTGKWSMPTPEGTFTINNKVPLAHSVRYNLNMPKWMAFVGSTYGIHGLPYRGKWVEGESHLGTPVSHGCVRLSWENADWLYDWAEIGTVVYIHK